jgi:hypothetical protein
LTGAGSNGSATTPKPSTSNRSAGISIAPDAWKSPGRRTVPNTSASLDTIGTMADGVSAFQYG